MRLFGVKDENKFEIAELSVAVVSKVDVKISASGINIAHRGGTFEDGKCRHIIAKFASRLYKNRTLHNRCKLRKKGRKCFI